MICVLKFWGMVLIFHDLVDCIKMSSINVNKLFNKCTESLPRVYTEFTESPQRMYKCLQKVHTSCASARHVHNMSTTSVEEVYECVSKRCPSVQKVSQQSSNNAQEKRHEVLNKYPTSIQQVLNKSPNSSQQVFKQ